MEEKEDRIEVGRFWDDLEKELELDSNPSNKFLVEDKPILPKSTYPLRTISPQNNSESNSIKIERKTPLDYIVRKNQQIKMSQDKNLPTYSEYNNKITPPERLEPTKNVPSYSTLRQQQQENHQQNNHTIYPRYQIPETSKSSPPPPPDANYLRSQMLKELRSQQERTPIDLPRGRLQPPVVPVPPSPVQFSPPKTESPQNTGYYSVYHEELSSQPEIINEIELLRCMQKIEDRTKIDVLLQLLDGNWHSESELLRIAKKTRDFIGSVGFGMLMCSFEDIITKSFLIKRIDPGNTSLFKINENYIALARSAYSQYKKSEN